MNCLRCGSECKETDLFCAECSKTVSVPLEDSPYLNTQISLPNRKPVPSAKKTEPKKERRRRPWRWIIATILLALLSTALLLQLGYTLVSRYEAQRELLRLGSVEDECVRLTEQLNEAQRNLSLLQEQLASSGNATSSELHKALAQAQIENIDLQAQLDHWKAQSAELRAQIDALSQKTDFYDSHIVFVQDDGTKHYHCYDCESFGQTGYWAYNTQQAISLGYLPCPRCLPPE